MEVLFWIFTIISILIVLWHIFFYKDYFSILTYTVLGIYVPLLMSFLNWSSYSVIDKGWLFYFIFISLDIVCIIYCFFPIKRLDKIKNIDISRKEHAFPLGLVNIVYIVCVLVENVYLSGFLFPSLLGIDVHTGRMPFIYFITTAIYIVVASDIMEFISTKKIRYIVYAVISFLINVISKSSRVDAGIAIVQIGSFLLFYFLSKNNDRKAFGKKLLMFFACFFIGFLIVNKGIEVGNSRMNSNGLYQTVYSDGIGYNGPKTTNEILEYYYGYFPMSFDNLSYNLQHVDSEFNVIGMNSFRCLYFGILQFDNLFNLDGSSAVKNKIIRCKAAAVPTIFWDFYYDFDILIIIPIFITFLVAYQLARKTVNKQTLMFCMLYFYWVPLWMFGSFDNRSYDYQIIWHVIMMYVLFKNRYIMNTADRNVVTKRNKRLRIKIGGIII